MVHTVFRESLQIKSKNNNERPSTNSFFCKKVADTSRPTTIRELAELVARGIFKRLGVARSVYYIVVKKQLKNDSNDSILPWLSVFSFP